MTYILKTHNPWILIACFFGSLLIWFLLFHNYGETMTLFMWVILCIISMIVYNYLAKEIEVTITQQGVNSTWMTAPFFIKVNKEILWTDILNWNFTSNNLMDIFSIKTKENQTLYIRCLSLYKRQNGLINFVNAFQNSVGDYNKKEKIENSKISAAPTIFEKPFGRIFSILLFGALIFITYRLITQGLNSLHNANVFSVTVIYINSLTWIGLTIFYYFNNKKKQHH